MIRDGPAGNVALQLPFAAVTTVAVAVNALDPLSGAVRMLKACSASGCPCESISRPRTVTDEPNATSPLLVGFTLGRHEVAGAGTAAAVT